MINSEAVAETKADSKCLSNRRIDSLDGVRTIAIGLVFLFHVTFPGISFGFIGVDVFFVLSGFLITSGLVKHMLREEHIALGDFWTRRFKRLLPAVIVLLIACFLITYFTSTGYQLRSFNKDSWWTVLYLANWHFMGSGSYFSSDGTQSILLHMWSLAVEEQFYFCWPLLLAALLWFLKRKVGTRKPKTAEVHICTILAIITVIAIAISSLLMVYHYQTAEYSDRAYMGTDTKIFEPLLGALLAVLVQMEKPSAWLKRYSVAATYIGFLGGASLLSLLSGPSNFYYFGGALIFSIFVMALIAGLVQNPNTLLSKGLSSHPIVYLGQISYGLYLWHWPFAVWFGSNLAFSKRATVYTALCTFIAAALSYHLVELPIRQGALSRRLTPVRTLYSSSAAIVMIICLVSAFGGTPFSPLLKRIVDAKATENNPLSSIMLTGDSVPKRLTPSFSVTADKQGIEVYSSALGACSPLGVAERLDEKDESPYACLKVIAEQKQQLKMNPGVVIWWSRYEIADREVNGKWIDPSMPGYWNEVSKEFDKAVDRLTKGGAKLVIVQTEPAGLGMYTRCSKEECHPFLRRMIENNGYKEEWIKMVREKAQKNPNVYTISMDSIVCPHGVPNQPDANGFILCDDKMKKTGTYLRPDGSHFDTDNYGEYVSKALLDKVRQALKQH